jgi:hypothetical protein
VEDLVHPTNTGTNSAGESISFYRLRKYPYNPTAAIRRKKKNPKKFFVYPILLAFVSGLRFINFFPTEYNEVNIIDSSASSRHVCATEIKKSLKKKWARRTPRKSR